MLLRWMEVADKFEGTGCKYIQDAGEIPTKCHLCGANEQIAMVAPSI